MLLGLTAVNGETTGVLLPRKDHLSTPVFPPIPILLCADRFDMLISGILVWSVSLVRLYRYPF